MRSLDFPPRDTVFLGFGGFRHERDFFAEIKIDGRRVVATLDFNQTRFVVLVAETASVTENRAVNVEAGTAFRSTSGSHD